MKTSDQKKRIVCIGGGTGTFVTLKGLKSYGQHLSAIVSMSDSGGSNKRIRDEFGLLPTSDIRQCFVALADENGGAGIMRKLFMYRFEKGKGISGMTFGNLFIAALADIIGSQKDAIKQTSKILRIKGTVIPVSYTKTNLIATYEDGSKATEEHLIDEPDHDGTLRITNIVLSPPAKANPDAIEVISKADMLVLGPGDLFTSVLPNLLVRGMSQAVRNTRAVVVYVVNLMTKWGQTYNFSVSDHVHAIERHIGKSIDYVFINNGKIPTKVLDLYEKQKEHPVTDDLHGKQYFRVIRKNFVNTNPISKAQTDILIRSLIRHDSDKLALELMKICNRL
jgi:uncharacterized cofD-like protein